jgi:hypothetical protein
VQVPARRAMASASQPPAKAPIVLQVKSARLATRRVS